MPTIDPFDVVSDTIIRSETVGGNQGVETKIQEIINFLNSYFGGIENYTGLENLFLLLTGGTITGNLKVRKDAPGLRLFGTEASAEEVLIEENTGNFLIRKNTGTEVNPVWETVVTIEVSTGNIISEGRYLPADVPSGETILFYKDTAVVGYNLLTTIDDKYVYITKGFAAGGETGGALHPTGTHTISGLTADPHTHDMNNHVHPIPHTHSVTIPYNGWSYGGGVTYGEMLIEDGAANQGHGDANRGLTSGGSSAANSGGPSVADTGTASANGVTSDGLWRSAAACFTMQQRV